MVEVIVVPISVAVIGGPLMWYLKKFDRNNSAQHDGNMHVLKRIEVKVDSIEDKVGKVDERLNNHIDRHHARPWFHLGGKRDRDTPRT
jgi:hypothetical protein